MNSKRAGFLLSEKQIEHDENHLLAPHTSFQIGGAATLAIFPKSQEEAVTAFRILQDCGMKLLVLGNGTNVLISDEGFDGAAVILSGMKHCEYRETTLYADSGVSLTYAAASAAKRSLGGFEFAYGIPGTVGGGIYMNAGAYGGEMAQITLESSWYDPLSGKMGKTVGTAHEFAYRNSVYMHSEKIILSAAFRLIPGERDEIEAKMADYMSKRREKQPLDYPSAGSVFKRGDGFITAKLIEEAGLKGKRIGGAEVSTKHAGFIVNRGGATAADVLALIELIGEELLRQFGKTISCEIRYIGK